ncbi:MAG: hypothetical protein KF824_04955 [Fimbriimonadaceae bacterium]|nr:MAG: hypothetical protein KF824_04955 [Fimbriimonadaceae bacterium]
MLTLGIPSNLYAYDPNKPVEVEEPTTKAKPVESRKLSAKEMGQLKGRLGNPYYAGQAKFDVVYKGVNLRTGNYSTSATDLSFEGGYGIPVNITRSYSANSIDEGPFGIGWTLSADLRSTAGGLLKSSKAPVRSVPTGMKRRPSSETDPNIPSQPVEAVIVTDADGKETTVQRDVDGILTTPPWDKNEYETEYEYVTFGGALYWVLISNKTMTPDGTVYQYEKQGEYTSGSKPWDDAGATAEPNNVLKPVWVKDRHNNETTYTYGTTPVTFTKSNGDVSENPLVGVDMPNGRSIELTWTGDRVTQIRAYSSAEERKVLYGYTSGQLTSVQQVRTIGSGSPEYGRINRYGYSGNLMTSMTDPRGMSTYISYSTDIIIDGYSYPSDSVRVTQITEPSGIVYTLNVGITNGLRTAVVGRAGGTTVPGEYSVVTYTPISGGMRVGEETDNGQLVYDSGPVDNPGFDGNTVVQVSTQKTYDDISQNLIEEQVGTLDPSIGNIGLGSVYPTISKKTTKYNFLGNPVEEKKYEYAWPDQWGQGAQTRLVTTDTAFWGEDKYFQQKAVRVTAGSTVRYSFTDYYDSSATQGKKGQTYKVYDNKHGGIWLDTGETVPSYGTAYAWKYQIKADTAKYSAKFDYDSKGRPVDVWKLQKVVSGTYNYVQTRSVYGADNAPAYGNATEVTEDYGGASARTTETLEFDLLGKAIETQDAANRVFTTTYDVDGNVLSVDQGSQNVVSYTYGTTDATVENGQPLTITDGLSGVEQEIDYVQSGVAKGAPATIVEDAGSSQVTTTDYTYDEIGNRSTSTIATPNGTTRYKYSGYGIRGTGVNVNRMFTRINKQAYVSGNWVNSAEEVRYIFNGLGQMTKALFAMTPQSSASNYDTTNAPLSFVSAEYEYDTSGRTLGVKHYWNQLVSGSYARESIRGTTAAYAHDLGLKTSTSFLTRATPGYDTWSTTRTEYYGYDSDFDYLTEVDYNDGLSNEVQTWGYDAAGNRISASAKVGSWTYDNLNRMTASPGATYEHDAVGNRTYKETPSSGDESYYWDRVNRLIGISSGIAGWDSEFTYRADGMRVKKEVGDGTTTILTRSYYDGQMPVEEDVNDGSSVKLTRSFVGARGIEAMTVDSGSGAVTSYPLYDTHGNMIATVRSLSGGTAWDIYDERNYDVWGGVRQGNTTGGPKGRYVANLGHVQDDESGLIYMRARYYEPESGRFISRDPGKSGYNWYIYASNLPTCRADYDGQSDENVGQFIAFLGILAAVPFAFGIGMWMASAESAKDAFEAITAATLLIAVIGTAWSTHSNDGATLKWAVGLALSAFGGTLAVAAFSAKCLGKLPTGKLAGAVIGYSLLIIGLLMADLMEGMATDSYPGQDSFWGLP